MEAEKSKKKIEEELDEEDPWMKSKFSDAQEQEAPATEESNAEASAEASNTEATSEPEVKTV